MNRPLIRIPGLNASRVDADGDVWFRGTGTIAYDPARGDMKRKTQWWCVINTDPEIARYYRYWVNKRRNPLGLNGHDLHLPAWGAHVTVFRGEKPKPEFMHLWKAYEGKTVDFWYKHRVENRFRGEEGNSPYWFLEVDCPFAKRMRDEMQVPSNWLFHFTVGRTY